MDSFSPSLSAPSFDESRVAPTLPGTKPRTGERRGVRPVERRSVGRPRRGRRRHLIPGHGTVALVFAETFGRGFRGFGVAETRGDEIGASATLGRRDGGMPRRRAQPAGRRETGVLDVFRVRAATHLGHLVLVRLAIPLGNLGGGVEVQDRGGAERLGGGCSAGRGGGHGSPATTTGEGGVGDVARGGPRASLAVAKTVGGAGGVVRGVSRRLGDGDRAAGERGAGVEGGAQRPRGAVEGRVRGVVCPPPRAASAPFAPTLTAATPASAKALAAATRRVTRSAARRNEPRASEESGSSGRNRSRQEASAAARSLSVSTTTSLDDAIARDESESTMRVALARKARAFGGVARRLVPGARPGLPDSSVSSSERAREESRGTRSHGQTV